MTAAALLRAALAFAPREFRREYADAMHADFTDLYREEYDRSGPMHALRYACTAAFDALCAALGERAAMIGRDVAYALRQLARAPVFALVVIVTLALAIGANAAVFSVVNGVLLKPLPYPHADRLVLLWNRRTDDPAADARRGEMSYEDARDIFRGVPALARGGVMAGWSGTVAGFGEPFRMRGAIVSAPTLSVFGARLLMGRPFTASDEVVGAQRVVLVTARFWKARLAADPAVLGRTLTVNDRVYRIVGVLSPDVALPRADGEPPQTTDLVGVLRHQSGVDQRGSRYLRGYAMLREGASLTQARAQLAIVQQRMNATYPLSRGFTYAVTPLADGIVGGIRPTLTILWLAVFGLLLVACANVANLILARAVTRRREFAVRRALGAGRGRLVAQLLTESALLAVAGGTLGVAVAAAAVRAFVANAPASIPRLDGVTVDPAVVALAAGLTALSAVLAGLAPALSLSRPDIASTLKEGDRSAIGGGARARDVFVVVEIALALALVVTSVLLTRSFVALRHTDVGYRTDHLIAVEGGAGLSLKRYPTLASRVPVYDRLTRELDAIPGVVRSGMALTVPLAKINAWSYGLRIVGRPPLPPGRDAGANTNAVTPGYFAAIGLAPTRGRLFTAADRAGGAPVALVDAWFAARYFPAGDALGHRIVLEGSTGAQRTIVGIVPAVRTLDLATPDRGMAYIPLAQAESNETTDVVLRVVGDPAAVRDGIAAAYRAAAPELPPPTITTFDALLARETARERMTAVLLGALAAIAMLLALAGISALVSYAVAQRTHEIGIRMALGARGRDVVRDVVLRAVRLTGYGIAGGLAVAAIAADGIRGQLYGVAPFDPATFVAVTAALLACTMAASLVPARRATRVDPVVALRYE